MRRKLIYYRISPFTPGRCHLVVLCGISSRFQLLSPCNSQIVHALLTRPPLGCYQHKTISFCMALIDLVLCWSIASHAVVLPFRLIPSSLHTTCVFIHWCLAFEIPSKIHRPRFHTLLSHFFPKPNFLFSLSG